MSWSRTGRGWTIVAVLVAANLGCGLVRFVTFRVAMLPRDVRRRRAVPS